MKSYENLTNRRFGLLVAQKFTYSDARGNAVWICKCDCGGKRTAPAHKLKSQTIYKCTDKKKHPPAPRKRQPEKKRRLELIGILARIHKKERLYTSETRTKESLTSTKFWNNSKANHGWTNK